MLSSFFNNQEVSPGAWWRALIQSPRPVESVVSSLSRPRPRSALCMLNTNNTPSGRPRRLVGGALRTRRCPPRRTDRDLIGAIDCKTAASQSGVANCNRFVRLVTEASAAGAHTVDDRRARLLSPPQGPPQPSYMRLSNQLQLFVLHAEQACRRRRRSLDALGTKTSARRRSTSCFPSAGGASSSPSAFRNQHTAEPSRDPLDNLLSANETNGSSAWVVWTWKLCEPLEPARGSARTTAIDHLRR
jgi:hypothetical protein